MSQNSLKRDKWGLPASLGAALKQGGPVVWASCLVMGLGNILAGQIVKGALFLAIEIAYIVFMCISGGGLHWLSLLPSLGTQEQGQVWDESQGIYVYSAGDNSQQILLYAVATLVLTVVVIYFWQLSVRSGATYLAMKKRGEKVPGIKQDIYDLFDTQIHKTLMTPPFAMLLIFTITPLVYMMAMAFTNYSYVDNHLTLFDWVGLSNFASIFDSSSTIGSQFWGVLGWTLIWAFFATFLNFFLGTIMAMIIDRKTTRLKGLWRTILSITIAVPQFVSLMIISTMFKDDGAVNRMLQSLGILAAGQNLPFWTDATWARITIILVNVWVGIPYTVMQVTGILKNIPAEQYEAAHIDGANAFQQFTNITLPYMFFVMTPYIITQFTGNINNFNVIYLLTGGGPTYTGNTAGQTDLLVTWLYKLSVDKQQYNVAAVIGILTFVILAVVSLITYRNSSSYKNEEAFK